MRGEMKSLVPMSLFPSPSLTSRTTSRSVGVSVPTRWSVGCVGRDHVVRRRSPPQWTGKLLRPRQIQKPFLPWCFAALPVTFRSWRRRSGSGQRRDPAGCRVPPRTGGQLRQGCPPGRADQRGIRECRARPDTPAEWRRARERRGRRIRDCAVQASDRGGHLVRLRLPQPRGAFDVGQQQRHRAGRQLVHGHIAPVQRRHLRVLAHGLGHMVSRCRATWCRPDTPSAASTSPRPRAKPHSPTASRSPNPSLMPYATPTRCSPCCNRQKLSSRSLPARTALSRTCLKALW